MFLFKIETHLLLSLASDLMVDLLTKLLEPCLHQVHCPVWQRSTMIQGLLVSLVVLDPLEGIWADGVRMLNLLLELFDDWEDVLKVTDGDVGLVIG